MKLTTRGQYSIVALTHMQNLKIKGKTNPVRLAEISAKEKISIHYLEQLFRKLRIAGLVKSVRGPGGGYVLRDKPINYKEVLEAVDENISFVDNISGLKGAQKTTFDNLEGLYRTFTDNLEGTAI